MSVMSGCYVTVKTATITACTYITQETYSNESQIPKKQIQPVDYGFMSCSNNTYCMLQISQTFATVQQQLS